MTYVFLLGKLILIFEKMSTSKRVTKAEAASLLEASNLCRVPDSWYNLSQDHFEDACIAEQCRLDPRVLALLAVPLPTPDELKARVRIAKEEAATLAFFQKEARDEAATQVLLQQARDEAATQVLLQQARDDGWA